MTDNTDFPPDPRCNRDGHITEAGDRNTDMFFAVADVLDFLPETYDQTEWGKLHEPDEESDAYYENAMSGLAVAGCQTTACVAGWVAILDGWHPTINYIGGGEDKTPIINYGEVSKTPLTDGTGRHRSNTDIRDVSDVAREILGISDDEAMALFESSPATSATGKWTGDELRKIGKGANIFAIQEEEGQQEDSDG